MASEPNSGSVNEETSLNSGHMSTETNSGNRQSLAWNSTANTAVRNNSVTVAASVENYDGRHFVTTSEPPRSASSINYANEEPTLVPPRVTTRLPPETSGIAIQQSMLLQNQMMFRLMEQMAKQQNIHLSRTDNTAPTENIDQSGNRSATVEESVSLDFVDEQSDNQSVSDHEEDSDAISDEISMDTSFASALDTTETGTGDAIIDDIMSFYCDEEQCSSAINEKLAAVINTGMHTKVCKDKQKDLLGKHFRPNNCENVVVPRLPPSIWNSLGRRQKDTDLKYQSFQSLVCKALYPLIHLSDRLFNATQEGLRPKEVKDCLSLANDTFKCLQILHTDISYRRKQNLLPAINEEFKSLCAQSNPVTSQLLGDELEQRIKEISDAKRVSKQITKSPKLSHKSDRFNPIRQPHGRQTHGGKHAGHYANRHSGQQQQNHRRWDNNNKHGHGQGQQGPQQRHRNNYSSERGPFLSQRPAKGPKKKQD
ncbi:uncharacterized protein [Argopecten irradians]|uniref:uncharacterized protein n=1 Tax=Argopecten irradians TaxID=31199 RepID=UPI00371D9EB8